jgi:hypothetical protein
MAKQNRRAFITNTAVLSAGALVAPALPANKNKVIVHHVFFWLKNPSSKEDLAKLIVGLKTLKSIKTIRRLHIGLPAATEERSVVDASYNVSELMFFDDLAGQKAYQDDPIHQKFIADCAHLWGKVVVYDSVDV